MRHFRWIGFADARPSESIQPASLPGIAVAVVFPRMPGVERLTMPIRQYKDHAARQKAGKAREMAAWLEDLGSEGLILAGFCNVHTQSEAAVMGLDLAGELPDTRVEPHYDAYRLYFGDDSVDFAHAVALQYYLFTIRIGIVRAGTLIPREDRRLIVAMDRFPGVSAGDGPPGKPLPRTDGARFLDYVQARSATFRGLTKQDRDINLRSQVTTLDWWKPKGDDQWREGKTHPHFVLPDWLVAAAMASRFPDGFAAGFRDERTGHEAVAALSDLYDSFKEFDIWSMTDSASHIVGSEELWHIPDDAGAFILNRAADSDASGA